MCALYVLQIEHFMQTNQLQSNPGGALLIYVIVRLLVLFESLHVIFMYIKKAVFGLSS